MTTVSGETIGRGGGQPARLAIGRGGAKLSRPVFQTVASLQLCGGAFGAGPKLERAPLSHAAKYCGLLAA